MKKVLFIIVMLMATLSSSSQNRVIDRNCTLSGSLLALCKTENIAKDSKIFPKGTMWYIENTRIGKENYVRFWIEVPEGTKQELNSWKEHGVSVYIIKGENNTKNYTISDDTFNYLTIIEVDGGMNVIQLLTKEL